MFFKKENGWDYVGDEFVIFGVDGGQLGHELLPNIALVVTEGGEQILTRA